MLRLVCLEGYVIVGHECQWKSGTHALVKVWLKGHWPNLPNNPRLISGFTGPETEYTLSLPLREFRNF